jgi:glycosyltransferase involved in cell wall biosynthesis
MNRRVLVVTYFFPPTGGIGWVRTLKYVTYLPLWGWQATCLTVKDAGYGLRDEASLRRVPPDLAVVRTRSAEPAKLRRFLASSVRRLRRSPSAKVASTAVAPSASPAAPRTPSGKGPSRVARIWGWLVGMLFFPDQQVGWVPFAVRAGTRAARRDGAEIVYSTSGPISAHIIAGLIAGRTKLPWVADFRDPWIGNAFAGNLPRWQRPLQRRLDRWIVRRADRVVFASDGFLEGYSARYPWAAEKMSVVPNGYDRNDFTPEVLAAIAAGRDARVAGASEGGEPGAPFRLIYAGTVYGEHELEIFLDGLELLLARRPDLREHLEVEYIGWLTLHNVEVAARYDTPERLGSVVRYTGFLPHHEALARMARADALFHVLADEPNKWRVASGKLTEYVGLDRQVIAFVPEGSARDLLRELDWGIVADPTPSGVADGIERLLRTPRPNRSADPEGRYDRVNLARRLAAVLDSVAGEGDPPPPAR